jgi:hypothetical protein
MASANSGDTWRDMIALLRAALNDDRVAMDAILDGPGSLRDLAEMQAGFMPGVMFRAFGAHDKASEEQVAKLIDAECVALLTQGPPGWLGQ